MKKLHELKRTQSLLLQKLQGSEDLCRDLEELGFIKGTVIERITKSFFGGPSLYQLRGMRIALRREEAECILGDLQL